MSIKNRITASVRKFHKYEWTVKIILVLFFLFFVLEAIVQLYPFIWVINNSLREEFFINQNSMALTESWKFSNFADVFTGFRVGTNNGEVYYTTMLFNSVWQTFAFLIVNLGSSTLVAYNLAKFRFPGRNFLYGFLIFVQTIPLFGAGAADFKLKYTLGMINNPATIWISWMLGFDYSTFIMFGAFSGISKSYSEAAEIDGANEFQIFFQIIMPQAVPALLALMVTNFVTRWNNYETSQIVLRDYPSLSYGLFVAWKDINLPLDAGGKYAALIMIALPGIILYAGMQNWIIKNMNVGGLKG